MKEKKEFRLKELDQTVFNKAPPRYQIGLGFGILLGGLAVGIFLPLASKLMVKESKRAHALPAKAIAAAPVEEDFTPEDPELNETAPSSPTAAVKPVSAVAPAKAVDPAKPEEKAPVESNAKSIVTAKPTNPPKAPEGKVPVTPSAKAIVTAKPQAPANTVVKAKEPVELKKADAPQTESKIAEQAAVPSALEIQTKADEALLKVQIPSAPASAEALDSSPFVTIYNVQYQKGELANCKKRCLMKSKDANGAAIYAVVSGPNFGDILQEHGGTINITGKKRKVKNVELFMVQNITFNLGPQKTVQKPQEVKKTNVHMTTRFLHRSPKSVLIFLHLRNLVNLTLFLRI